jgi:tetratricopeptide (TPR) repeat protein
MSISLLLIASVVAGAPNDSVPLYNNLGDHHYAITTTSPRAQQYFDQGLRLYYAFNHAESIRAFREAQRLDPSCAMCVWGEALALGPNINLPMDAAAGVDAHEAATRARALLREGHPDIEHALIDAISVRYAAMPVTTSNTSSASAPSTSSAATRAALDSAYAQAMAQVARRFRDNQEAAVLYAESQMTLRPWNYWTRARTLQPGISKAIDRLEGVMRANPQHPGACHFFIHAVEAVQPQRAVACAERLAALMPGAGHLVHMPGHIYIRVGRYTDAIRANEHAVHADESFIRDQQPGAGVYTLGYYPHNYDFLAFAAAMAGRREQSLEAADKLASLAAPEMMGAPGMTFLQHHGTRHLQMRVRFGAWEEILRAKAPDSSHPHARAMWHYARGRAFVAMQRLPEAVSELSALRTVMEHPALPGMRLEFNESAAVLRIAEQVLAGILASAKGHHSDAVAFLTNAVEFEDALTYGEPPDWSVPVRQDLGAVLLAAKEPAAAARAYEQDLERFPANGWSLSGLERALIAQGRTHEAARTRKALRAAWANADVVTQSHH